MNVHLHSLVLDGIYARSAEGALRFHPLPPPDDAEVERVARQIARRLDPLLERRGRDPPDDDALAIEEPLLASLYAASITSRIATGPRAGQRVARLGDRVDADDLAVCQGERCASVGGVSVHANVAVPARDRRRLERLCRDGARPPIATERLSRLEDGRLLYRLKHRWRDGTTHVVFTPQELGRVTAGLRARRSSELIRSSRGSRRRSSSNARNYSTRRGEADLLCDFAFPLPAIVIALLLGAPPADIEPIKEWSERLAAYLGGSIDERDNFAEAQTGSKISRRSA